MKKRILIWLSVAVIVYLIAFAIFYKETKGDVLSSLEYAGIATGALAFVLAFYPADVARAEINAVRFGTDTGTGGLIDKLAEQNRHLEEQNRILKEQNSMKSDITEGSINSSNYNRKSS